MKHLFIINIFLSVWLFSSIIEVTSSSISYKNRHSSVHRRIKPYYPRNTNTRSRLKRPSHHSPLPKYKRSKTKTRHLPSTYRIGPNHFVHFCGSTETKHTPTHPTTNFHPPQIFEEEEYEVYVPKTEIDEQLQLNIEFSTLYGDPSSPDYAPTTAPKYQQTNHYENQPIEEHKYVPTEKYKYDYVEIPHLHDPPLEHDPSKSTYNTPGAVNSYGSPVTVHDPPQSILNERYEAAEIVRYKKNFPKQDKIENYFEVNIHDLTASSADYDIKKLNNNFVRPLDLTESASLKYNTTSRNLPNGESNFVHSHKAVNETTRHPNHRYE